jgi:hypothetical protein
MAQSRANPILDYQVPVRRYRPRAWKAVLTVLLPWFAQAFVTWAMYWSRPNGRQGHGGWLVITMLVGIVGGCIMIARSGFKPRLKFGLIVLYVPIQFYCIFTVMDSVALACGATDAY